jgi:hypothetical protein
MGIKIRHTHALIGFLPIRFRVLGTHCHLYKRQCSAAVCRGIRSGMIQEWEAQDQVTIITLPR